MLGVFSIYVQVRILPICANVRNILPSFPAGAVAAKGSGRFRMM